MQKVVRTYPSTYTNSDKSLKEYLDKGWKVVLSNPFDCTEKLKGNEYILEKPDRSLSIR